jgi:integrase
MGGRAIDVSMFPQRDRRRRLTDEEATRLRDALVTFEEPWREFFALSLHTGTRRQSLLTMRWDDVDLRRATWTIPAHWSKHGDEVLVPLTAEATALLFEMKTRRGASAWVFPSSRSSSGHITEPKKAWARLLKAAGIEGLTIHDLRRTFGSRLAESGASGAVIAAAMGHKSLQSAKPYLHLQVEIVRQHMERASIKRGD